jgi:predicted alpha/beta hydrolase family esterase
MLQSAESVIARSAAETVMVVVPGIGGSGEDHWMTLWQQDLPGSKRISPRSWDEPELDDWVSSLDRAAVNNSTVLVAHSLGCLLAIEWARRHPTGTAGLFLVALPDPTSTSFPLLGSPFASIDLGAPLPVPALVVASDNDPYCDIRRSVAIADGLGAGWMSKGSLGHINATSALGHWRDGQDLLLAFATGAGVEAHLRG